MSESENQKSVNTGLNSTVGGNNEEAKKAAVKERKRVKKTTAKPITSKKPLDNKDHMILNDAKNGVEMNIICARFMVHRTYVEQLVEKYG